MRCGNERERPIWQTVIAKTNWRQFSCDCSVIFNEFRHNNYCQSSLRILSTYGYFDNVITKFMINNWERPMKNWRQFVKLTRWEGLPLNLLGTKTDLAHLYKTAKKTYFYLYTICYRPYGKWLPLNYSFVRIQNSLNNLVRDKKSFLIIFV